MYAPAGLAQPRSAVPCQLPESFAAFPMVKSAFAWIVPQQLPALTSGPGNRPSLPAFSA